jgi:3-dehydroquinate synthetase
MGLLKLREKDRLTALLRKLGLPTRLPGIKNRSLFIAALGADKKSEQGAARFVLLSSIGHSVIGVHVPQHVLESVLTRR